MVPTLQAPATKTGPHEDSGAALSPDAVTIVSSSQTQQLPSDIVQMGEGLADTIHSQCKGGQLGTEIETCLRGGFGCMAGILKYV